MLGFGGFFLRRRRVLRRLGRYCRRTAGLDELRHAWCRASAADQVRFLAEVEELPY